MLALVLFIYEYFLETVFFLIKGIWLNFDWRWFSRQHIATGFCLSASSQLHLWSIFSQKWTQITSRNTNNGHLQGMTTKKKNTAPKLAFRSGHVARAGASQSWSVQTFCMFTHRFSHMIPCRGRCCRGRGLRLGSRVLAKGESKRHRLRCWVRLMTPVVFTNTFTLLQTLQTEAYI